MDMTKNNFVPLQARVIIASLLLAFLGKSADASVKNSPATEALIEKVAALTEHGDPAAMEKMTAGYLIDASRKFNPEVPEDTWKSVRADVNDVISKKIKSGYGEQALLTRRFVESANFSDDELRHLITIMQDPVMQRWGA
nr:hypothetical protein HUO10_006031 [Paraburkholderia busanensis]